MANANKHKERSKRSSHIKCPTDIFETRARWKKIQKENMRKIKEEKEKI